MWTCKHCNNEFNFSRTTDKANHSRHCDKNPKKLESYVKNKIKINERIDANLGELTHFGVECTICDKSFQVEERSLQFPLKEKYYCTRKCANSVGGNAKALLHHPDSIAHYTTVCWRHHTKKCIMCPEDKIVAVHHNDHNHGNNDPKNLIPLCPTHHQYVHSRYRDEVQPTIDEYVKNKWGCLMGKT